MTEPSGPSKATQASQLSAIYQNFSFENRNPPPFLAPFITGSQHSADPSHGTLLVQSQTNGQEDYTHPWPLRPDKPIYFSIKEPSGVITLTTAKPNPYGRHEYGPDTAFRVMCPEGQTAELIALQAGYGKITISPPSVIQELAPTEGTDRDSAQSTSGSGKQA
jgi:hypothetical protein